MVQGPNLWTSRPSANGLYVDHGLATGAPARPPRASLERSPLHHHVPQTVQTFEPEDEGGHETYICLYDDTANSAKCMVLRTLVELSTPRARS
eukprot:3861220-Amphidinium_carterae.1